MPVVVFAVLDSRTNSQPFGIAKSGLVVYQGIVEYLHHHSIEDILGRYESYRQPGAGRIFWNQFCTPYRGPLILIMVYFLGKGGGSIFAGSFLI